MAEESEVRELFDRFERQTREYNPALAGMHGSYRFDVTDVGSWYVEMQDGTAQVIEGSRDADCVIECTGDDLLRAVRGDLNLISALLQGRVEVRGDLALAQKFHGFVRALSLQAETARRG